MTLGAKGYTCGPSAHPLPPLHAYVWMRLCQAVVNGPEWLPWFTFSPSLCHVGA